MIFLFSRLWKPPPRWGSTNLRWPAWQLSPHTNLRRRGSCSSEKSRRDSSEKQKVRHSPFLFHSVFVAIVWLLVSFFSLNVIVSFLSAWGGLKSTNIIKLIAFFVKKCLSQKQLQSKYWMPVIGKHLNSWIRVQWSDGNIRNAQIPPFRYSGCCVSLSLMLSSSLFHKTDRHLSVPV